jgi:putative transposase
MPRRLRRSLQGAVFHVMNRAVRRTTLFRIPQDYDAFLAVVRDGLRRAGIKVIAYCVMPNHWHFVVICDRIEQVSKWLHWVTTTHAVRWNIARRLRGTGAVYQSRFKAVPIQRETSLARVCRYVERNALRKGLVGAAEYWPWGSLHAWCNKCDAVALETWPILRPVNWIEIVNTPENRRELEDLRRTIARNQPIGDPDWQKAVAPFIGLSMRSLGRPRKEPRPLKRTGRPGRR